MNDLSIPHASFFRPPVKFKCVDGFLGIGPAMRDAQEVADPASFSARSAHQRRAEASRSISRRLVRSAAQLLADVGDFMTLAHGDVLMLGCDAGRPLARAGRPHRDQRAGLRDAAQHPGGRAAMKHARVIFEGAVHDADRTRRPPAAGRRPRGRASTPSRGCRRSRPTPRPRTILALGLNYADHAKELEFKAPEEPLVFVKGESTLTGHRQITYRPAGVHVHALRMRAGDRGRQDREARSGATTPTTSSAATRSPTTTRSATTSRTGTAPTCA